MVMHGATNTVKQRLIFGDKSTPPMVECSTLKRSKPRLFFWRVALVNGPSAKPRFTSIPRSRHMGTRQLRYGVGSQMLTPRGQAPEKMAAMNKGSRVIPQEHCLTLMLGANLS